ncbi:hypothetical protein GCG54_00012733 [Colletotrichum gloeosporioides]|uniref:Uncharacterized protein n=1 Tax=Colletotrichum gloeosporioides TaxID=474922 RepID=A0A8H4CT38_COLGL|nr:uncharacterized protein GCG54_00012733 [Colletotrichum gloeosporioides]KAF3809452.1 hypothetical protein GCG54_00012733 [Colletotrichum gloeosporioides]
MTRFTLTWKVNLYGIAPTLRPYPIRGQTRQEIIVDVRRFTRDVGGTNISSQRTVKQL